MGVRKGPSGGAWRAFVREETFGTVGSADLREVAAKYKELDAETLDRLKVKGRQATKRAASGGPPSRNGEPFLPLSKCVV